MQILRKSAGVGLFCVHVPSLNRFYTACARTGRFQPQHALTGGEQISLHRHVGSPESLGHFLGFEQGRKSARIALRHPGEGGESSRMFNQSTTDAEKAAPGATFF